MFGLPEPALGLIPGGGGTQRLPRLIGLGRALQLLLTAERIDAAEAYRLGVITQLVPNAEALQEHTRALTARIAALPPLAIQAVKRAVLCGTELDLASGLRVESELFISLLATQDRLEAAAALEEKRQPVFTGT
jgi:enoyl-CoA hydratase/carnithine racemase